jgi:hypothetical protein
VTAYLASEFHRSDTTPGSQVFEELYANGILLAHQRYPMLENFLRVSVGLPQENDHLEAYGASWQLSEQRSYSIRVCLLNKKRYEISARPKRPISL